MYDCTRSCDCVYFPDPDLCSEISTVDSNLISLRDDMGVPVEFKHRPADVRSVSGFFEDMTPEDSKVGDWLETGWATGDSDMHM